MKIPNDSLSPGLGANSAIDSPTSSEPASAPYPVQPLIQRPKLDRLLVFTSLIVMAGTASVASLLVIKKREQIDTTAKTEAKEEQAVSNNPQWHADWPTDIEALSKKSIRLVSDELSVVIFSSGTCVLVNEPVEDIQATATDTLRITADPSAVFETKYLPNNNYIVTFSPSVFSWIEAKNIATYKNSVLENTAEGLSEEERNELRGRKLPLTKRVGVLARSKLLQDSDNPRILKIIKARKKDSSMTQNINLSQ